MTNKPMLKILTAAVLSLAWSGTAQAQFCPLPGQTGTCIAATTVLPLSPLIQPKFVYELPQPVFYEPDKTAVPGFDYYEVQVSPVTQFPVAFPQPGAPGGEAVARSLQRHAVARAGLPAGRSALHAALGLQPDQPR